MRRVLVVTWALGTASGVLLGLFGVQLVSSRFSTSRVSPLSHPEVLRALQAARSVPTPDVSQVALPPASVPETTSSTASPPTDAAPARPSAGAASSPAEASPASALPRPGATAGTLVGVSAAAAPSTTSTVTVTTAPPPPPEPTTTTTDKSDSKGKSKSDKTSTTTTTAKRSTTTTTAKSSSSSRSTTKTISSRGGVVTVRFDDGKVEIRSARPNAGYEMRVASNGPDEVLVYFWKQGRFSEVRASYRDGDPSTTVNEWVCSGSYPNIRCRQQ